jgi:hypothetical protein
MISPREVIRSLTPLDALMLGGVVITLLGLAYLVLIVLPMAVHKRGVEQGQAQCTAATSFAAASGTAAAAASQANQAQADIERGNQAATANERAQVRIVTHYRTLESEARHAPPNPVDACALPPERLRIWAAANAGPASAADPAHQGQPASQPDAAAPAAATTDIGGDTRPGAQPPRGGAGLPPTRSEAVQPAAAPGDRAP